MIKLATQMGYEEMVNGKYQSFSCKMVNHKTQKSQVLS